MMKKTLEIMMKEECLNRDCVVSKNSEGLNIFNIEMVQYILLDMEKQLRVDFGS